MASAAVTGSRRERGWNILLLLEPVEPFAGVFQTAKNASLTFRDIVDEMRLCFEFPKESSELWGQVAFGLSAMVNVTEEECPAPKFIHGDGLDQAVPALPEQTPGAADDRARLKYLVFRHGACKLAADKPLKSHFEAGCAQHLSEPERRLDPRYLPPNKPSKNPRYFNYPFRKAIRGRKPASSSKRSASGSASPSKDQGLDQADEDIASTIAPANCNIDEERARLTIAGFRGNCLDFAKHCAVTGMGRSWFDNPTIGPALQACHIIPELHYHTYMYCPPQSNAGESLDDIAKQLKKAWERTWAPQNGILLFSHLHEMFDQRLFSIHPETLRIRAFMPYDVLVAYHGQIAKVSTVASKHALRHHYDMCCIENMAAKTSFVEPGTTAATSGISTPLELRPGGIGIASPRILDSPSEQNEDEDAGSDGRRGDPSKRARRTGKQANDSYITPENSEWFLESVNWGLIR